MRPAAIVLVAATCHPPQAAPVAPDICAWQVNVVRNTLVAGDKREQADELLRLAAVERELEARAGVPAQRRQGCRRALHDTLGDLISVWNRELTTGCTAYAGRHWPLLEALFREFLATFPDDPKAPEFRRLLGDLLRRERQ